MIADTVIYKTTFTGVKYSKNIYLYFLIKTFPEYSNINKFRKWEHLS